VASGKVVVNNAIVHFIEVHQMRQIYTVCVCFYHSGTMHLDVLTTQGVERCRIQRLRSSQKEFTQGVSIDNVPFVHSFRASAQNASCADCFSVFAVQKNLHQLHRCVPLSKKGYVRICSVVAMRVVRCHSNTIAALFHVCVVAVAVMRKHVFKSRCEYVTLAKNEARKEDNKGGQAGKLMMEKRTLASQCICQSCPTLSSCTSVQRTSTGHRCNLPLPRSTATAARKRGSWAAGLWRRARPSQTET
jgi:hypothetical protein